MSTKIHPHPLSFHSKPKQFDPPTPFINKDALQKELARRGLNIKLGNSMKGGVISQIYEADLDGQKVVVKHTEDRSMSLFTPPFSPYDFFIEKEGHNLDTVILQRLEGTSIHVPHVIRHFPDIYTTIMSDLREEGFELMMDVLIEKRFTTASAHNLGTQMAELIHIMKSWGTIETTESAQQQIHQRGMELRMFYTNTQEYFLEMESHYCKADGQLIWPDGHPKNIFTDKNGNVAFIDFGRVHMGDKHFVLPNFLAHIALYGIAGYLEKGLMLSYLSTAIESYNAVETLNEELFCKYFGMEVLHRSSGKWIAGIDDRNLKLKNIGLGLTIFDEKIVTIDNLLGMIDETA